MPHLAIWAAWTVPPAFVTAISMAEQRGPLWQVIITEFLPWYYWAFWTLPIARYSFTHPVESLRTARGIGGQVRNALLIGSGCGIFSTLLTMAFGDYSGNRTVAQLFISAILFWCIFGLIFYSLISAIAYVVAGQASLRERERAAAHMEARLAEAQLNGLRTQLQPHFLFNTLNTVAMYVREGDANTSIRVLTGLSELLRRVLDNEKQQEVTLGVELDHVERYLEIERLRFIDKLEIHVDVPPDVRHALVPSLALQPLLENAVRHGIAHRTDNSVIRLTALREGPTLTIRIYNDGPSVAADLEPIESPGIGLRNTALRLRHLYNGGASLKLSNVDTGVLAEMRLPYHV
jgi:two-component system, LytTR family, sensor kinase